jgi:hypothetical protein
MIKYLSWALPVLVCCLAISRPIPIIAGPDCPNESTARNGFIVERNHETNEVIRAGDRLIRTIFRSGRGQTLLETTTFEGLFDLERIDRGRRTVLRPVKDLDTLSPLKVGREWIAQFESGEASQVTRMTQIALRVVRADSLFIESCRYSVLVIERRIARGDAAPVLVETDYYVPDLKLIIAKEFKNPDGTSFLAKFDRIYSARH